MKLRQFPVALGLISIVVHIARADDASAISGSLTNTMVVTNTAAMMTNPPVIAVTNTATPSMAATSNVMAAPVVVTTVPEPAPAAKTVFVSAPPSRPFMIGGEIGTTGGGPVGRWQFADHLGVGVAYDYLSVTYNGKIQGNEYRTHLRLSTVPITLDGYPLNNNYLRLSGGVVINRSHFTGASTGTVDLNGTPYVGTARLDIRQQPVNPYFAVGGNFYFTRDHRFSMGGEFGLLYTGEPRVHLTLNPPNGAVETQRRQEENQIRHYARYAEVWPVLKLSINYSF